TYCSECQGLRDRDYESSRPDAQARGYGSRWRKEAKAFLKRNPWCVHCLAVGLRVQSEQVDHIRPHKGNQRLFWDKSNWQALCKPCH
ncbi:MAG: HNH endonuclease signature motif containing protein, partial [Candidatus Paceibacterota bacterium]